LSLSEGSSKRRVDYSLDSSLVDQFNQLVPQRERSQKVQELMAGYIREHTLDPAKAEEERLQDEFVRVDKRLGVLEDEGNKEFARFRRIAAALMKTYPTFGEDFRAIRFRALEDFRAWRQTCVKSERTGDLRPLAPSWIQDSNIRREHEIIETCQVAAELLRLRARQKELVNLLHP